MEARRRDNWFESHPRIGRLMVLVLAVLFLEGVARLLVAAHLLPWREYPVTVGAPRFWGYVDPVVGIWRYPNASFRHDHDCIHVEYRTNADGARDRERERRSAAPRRVVVLGDSFVEGYGFDAADRFTELLEARTGVEFLNFGTSGGFGTVQEWLLYDSRVRPYDHSDVMLFINPANDFKDNDPREFRGNVYRPFLRRKGTGYEVYYPVAWEKRETASRSRGEAARNVVLNHVYLWNVVRTARRELRDSTREARLQFKEAHYGSYRPEDLDVLLYSLEQLVRDAGDRRVWLVTVPSVNDFEAARRDGYEFALPRALADFATGHPNVRYLDLLPEFLRDAGARGLSYADYTLPCDNHWGARGHAFVADVVQRWMSGEPPGAGP